MPDGRHARQGQRGTVAGAVEHPRAAQRVGVGHVEVAILVICTCLPRALALGSSSASARALRAASSSLIAHGAHDTGHGPQRAARHPWMGPLQGSATWTCCMGILRGPAACQQRLQHRRRPLAGPSQPRHRAGVVLGCPPAAAAAAALLCQAPAPHEHHRRRVAARRGVHAPGAAPHIKRH